LRGAARRDHHDRVPDGQSVQGLGHRSAVLHPRLRPRLRPQRAQDYVDGAGRPHPARPRPRRGSAGAGAGRGIRDVAFRQCAGDRLCRASQAAALRGLPVRTRSAAETAQGIRRRRGPIVDAGGRGMNAPTYNFAYLDEQTKRMIRRAILKAIAIPGYQVPFASREMPMPYGWGTGGVQVTASILGPDDVLKVIDQGLDDTTNAVSIRKFFTKTAGVRTTTATLDATVIQTRHRVPETALNENQVLVYQVPIPEPL